jgi:hypothetical protein
MTPATYALLALFTLTLFGCIAFALPPRRVEPHPFVTDPFELADDHIGRHERPDEGTTRRLIPPTMRHLPDQDQ